jgi:hypothetical protein
MIWKRTTLYRVVIMDVVMVQVHVRPTTVFPLKQQEMEEVWMICCG